MKSNKLTLFRRLSQIGMLFILGQWSFYGIFRCPFPVPFISCINCPVISCQGRMVTLFWGTWLIVPLSVILFGRVFCGWACPGGLVTQLIGKLAILKVRVKNVFNIIAPWGKYLGLALALYLWLAMDNPRWAVPIRVGAFWNSITLTFEHANNYWRIRTLFVLGFLAAGLVLSNVWCRYACPTGGLLEVFKRFSLFMVFKTDGCKDCNTCRKVCEMGTRPQELNCTNCGDCLKICPENAIELGRKR